MHFEITVAMNGNTLQ